MLTDAGISMFHMTDFECRQDEFRDWSNDKRRSVIQRAHSLIKLRTNVGICSAVILKDYDEVFAAHPDIKAQVRSPFSLCVNGCLREIANWNERFKRYGQPIAYIFESGDKGKGEIIEVFDKISRDPILKVGSGYESLAFADKRTVVQLQAADINAYEGWKQMVNRILASPPTRPVRRSMWSLAGHTNFSRYFDRQVLLELVDVLRKKSAAQGA